jgi:hypothetical protein
MSLDTRGAPSGYSFIALRRIEWMPAIRAQVTELVTHRFVVLRYPIDSKEYAQTRHAEVSDCEVLAMRERGVP